MTPTERSFTLYVGLTFGPYIYYFSRTRAAQLGTVTVDPATDLFTLANHGLVNGDQVRFAATDLGAFPTPLQGVYYFVVGASTNSFAVALVAGGPTIDIVNQGNDVITLYKRGTPLNITGWTIRSWVKHSVEDPDSKKILDLAPTIADAPNGKVQIYVTDENTIGLKVGDHVQSIMAENLTGERLGPYLVGDFLIRKITTSTAT